MPFLLLATRAEDAAADNENESFLAFTGLDEAHLRRVRLERQPWGNLDLLDDWSGIFLGGGPINSGEWCYPMLFAPSSDSRMMSACPACWAVSARTCSRTRRADHRAPGSNQGACGSG